MADFDPMQPLRFRIIAKRDKRPDCVMLTVQPVGEISCCGFAPGQFYMLYAFGHGEVPVSVSGDPADSSCLLFTIKEVGSVTSALCEMAVGDMLGLRGPFGSVWPLDKLRGRDVVLMAGGLGIAPLRPAILRLIQERGEYGRVMLLYGARAPERILFGGDLEDWKKKIDVIVTVDEGSAGWQGPVGLVTEQVAGLGFSPEKSAALVCGPEPMMRFSIAALRRRGMVSGNIHLSMERNMKCAIAQCGRCQFGPHFICSEGPVFSFDHVEALLQVEGV